MSSIGAVALFVLGLAVCGWAQAALVKAIDRALAPRGWRFALATVVTGLSATFLAIPVSTTVNEGWSYAAAMAVLIAVAWTAVVRRIVLLSQDGQRS